MISMRILDDSYEVIMALRKNEIYKNILNTEELSFDWRPDFDTIMWISVLDDYRPYGLLILQQISPRYMVIHGGIYFNNKRTAETLRFCLDILKNIFKQKFITTINESNRAALRVARKAGFKEQFRLKNFYQTADAVILAEV